jgi:hypothetical protein
MFGVYRVQVYLPWSRRRGPKLPVTLRVNGVDSQKTGPAVPYITVD